MAFIIPDSRVDMYFDVPISGDHQLVFSTEEKQKAYFASKRLVTKAGCSYVRKTGRLRIEFDTARVQQCNYMSFTNTSFENVTFYARIIDWSYVNNTTTDILYEIDYWQTYMFDADYHECQIDREHLTESDYQKAEENPYRRDIPELLTDENLPCGKEYETYYPYAPFTILGYDGLRSSLPAYPWSKEGYDIVIYLSDCSFEEWEETDAMEFLECFDFINNKVVDPSDVVFPKLINFSSWKDNFVRNYAILTIKYDQTTGTALSRLDKAINFLTIYGVTSSIIGIYVLPRWVSEGFGNEMANTLEFPVKIKGITDDPLNGKDPKLKTFPFRYLRVDSPIDTKEYNISLFKDASDVGLIVNFVMAINFNGLPTVSLYPVKYKADNYLWNGNDYNYKERIDFSAFPQVGYSCDAYLTFLSTTYAGAIRSNTISGNIGRTTGVVGGALGAGLGAAGISTSLGRNVTAPNEYGYSDTYKQDMNAGGLMKGAGGIVGGASAAASQIDYILGSSQGTGSRSSFSNNYYDDTRRGYLNDQYTPGAQSGQVMYDFDNIRFYVTLVTLAPDIADKYTDYFKAFGYKSLRVKKPSICDYIKTGNNKPHFETLDDGKMTYVKTINMHVTGLMQTACAFIENMFDTGVRLIDGDTL